MKRILVMMMLAVALCGSAMAQTSLGQRVWFKKDSVNVQLSQEAMVGMVAEYINNHADKIYIVAGFTSTDTPEVQRDELCEARAKAVVKMLVEKYNVNPEILVPIGVGVSTRSDENEFNEYVTFFTK